MPRPEISKTPLAQRLRELRGSLERDQWADGLGVSKTTIANYERGDRVPDASFLEKLADMGVNMQWLITGETGFGGEQPRPKSLQEMKTEYEPAGPGLLDSFGFSFIPRYSVSAAAGHGRAVLEEHEADRLAFRSDWLRSIGVNPACCGLITVVGDSQNPTIPNGSIALIDMTPGQQLRSGSFYAVLIDGDLLIKRLYRRIDGTVELISDNPAYPKEIIPPKQLDRLNVPGRVVWVGRSI